MLLVWYNCCYIFSVLIVRTALWKNRSEKTEFVSLRIFCRCFSLNIGYISQPGESGASKIFLKTEVLALFEIEGARQTLVLVLSEQDIGLRR